MTFNKSILCYEVKLPQLLLKPLFFLLLINIAAVAQQNLINYKELNDKIFEIGDRIILPRNIFYIEKDEKITLASSVKDKSSLSDSARYFLNQVANFLRKNKALVIEIANHTEVGGGAAYAMQITDSKAQLVFDFLTKEGGVDPKRLTYKGYGNTQPVVSDAELIKIKDGEKRLIARTKNNRTELRVVGIDKNVITP